MDLLTWVPEQGGDTLSWLVIKDGDVFIRAAGGEERPRRIHLNLQKTQNVSQSQHRIRTPQSTWSEKKVENTNPLSWCAGNIMLELSNITIEHLSSWFWLTVQTSQVYVWGFKFALQIHLKCTVKLSACFNRVKQPVNSFMLRRNFHITTKTFNSTNSSSDHTEVCHEIFIIINIICIILIWLHNEIFEPAEDFCYKSGASLFQLLERHETQTHFGRREEKFLY